MRSLFLSIIVLCMLAVPCRAAVSEAAAPESPFTSNVRALVFADMQSVAHSTQNPENAFLQLPRYSGSVELRPDLFWDRPLFSAVFKPRFTASYRRYEDGVLDGSDDTARKGTVNEWRVQAKPSPTFFLSFGKEKLLWGPSFLASPSNILFKDIEKMNPKAEVEGKYLARAVYMPNTALTVNAIVETQQEESGRRDSLKPLRALKADLVGSDYMLSLIGYGQQNGRYRLGSFGQWTTSDALVVYYDGIVSKGTDALYPVLIPGHPFGGMFADTWRDSSRLFTTVTAGGSYTFLSGSTLSVEFLYNGQGYDDAEADAYYALRRTAGGHFFDHSMLSGLSLMTLNDALNTGSPFLRRYYAMAQYQVREIANVLDIVLRYAHGLEEHAGQASSVVEWRVSDRVQVFNINTIAIDTGGDTEFNSIIGQSIIAGVEVHF